MVRAHQRIQVSNHKFLAGRNIVAQQALDHAIHHLGMKDVPDQRHQQQQEWEKRQNGVGGNREGESMHLGPEHVARGGAHQAFGGAARNSAAPFLSESSMGVIDT